MKFYQRNDHIINSDVNVNFEDLLEMTPDQFKDWVVRLREELTYAWDTYGCPPRTGKNEEDMIAAFNRMSEFPVHEFEFDDEIGVMERTRCDSKQVTPWCGGRPVL